MSQFLNYILKSYFIVQAKLLRLTRVKELTLLNVPYIEYCTSVMINSKTFLLEMIKVLIQRCKMLILVTTKLVKILYQ